MKRLGFFGGCFNPPTIAHIELIEKTIKENNLDKVYFVPMGDNYPKDGLIPAYHRIKMLESVLKDKMDLLYTSVFSPYPMTAADCFREIEEEFKDSENFYIMGSDNFSNIETWPEYEFLMQNFKYIILDRDQKISSRKVRMRLKKGQSVKDLIYEEVEQYIIDNKLYQ